MSDGLVSNASLMLGLAAAHPAMAVVRLTGLAGLLAGALSMAAGEYLSMRAQAELLERELDVERAEIRDHPDSERAELVETYRRRGIGTELAERLAAEMMATPERALRTHAREEHGIDPDELGSPLQAALASFGAFALGAFVPLLGFLLGRHTGAEVLATAFSAVAALAIGATLAAFTGRPWWRSALRQLVLCAAAASVTYALGAVVGLGRSG